MHLRADDGIRTRDPHLGKVMRYQLRYVRAQRARSSPGAKHDDSPRERAHTNFSERCVSRLALAQVVRSVVPPVVLVFDLVRLSARSRGSVEERPLHTRKVAGSIPAGTTRSQGVLPDPDHFVRCSGRCGSRRRRGPLHRLHQEAPGRPRWVRRELVSLARRHDRFRPLKCRFWRLFVSNFSTPARPGAPPAVNLGPADLTLEALIDGPE